MENSTYLKNVKYLFTTSQVNMFPKDSKPEVLLMGRSNVGKSSFINSITKNSKLAKISKQPGKTRALSFFDVDSSFLLVDSPGYGYAKVSNTQKEIHQKLFHDYFSNSKNLVLVVLLLDLRRTNLSNEDIDILKFLKKNKIPIILIGTKLDKLNQSELHSFNSFISSNKNTKDLELIKHSSFKGTNHSLIIKRLFQLTKNVEYENDNKHSPL